MKRIAFVVVWMGKLPDYFQAWLNSCKNNTTIDFYVFTDALEKKEVLSNVHIIPMKFEEVKEKIQSIFDFPICLDRPYKLCDYKPTYGEAFEDYLNSYDFWGYCDMDLIWGNIRSFITDEVLEKNDRIFTRGHCSLFRNNKEVNSFYRTLDARGHLDFQKVYQSKEIWCFDEWGEHCGGGISVIFKENGIFTYDEPVMADIRVGCGSFYVNRRPELGKIRFFSYEAGVLKGISRVSTEFLYCHFQKRKVTIPGKLNEDKFVFVPYALLMNEKKGLVVLKSKWKCLLLDMKYWIKCRMEH